MKEAIRQKAVELGLDDCRFTTADPPVSFPRFEAWLRDGFHGTMEYLTRQTRRRADLRELLPNARSLIVVAASYHGADRPAAAREPAAIARYARGADYHDWLGRMLRALTDHVNTLGGPGTQSLWYTDTGPMLERDLAERAGLGFVGKHTNLVGRRLGNWFLLGEVLTTLAIAPDAPERNRCGRCTRCLDACPTGALVGPFRLDARRCISYLTIEFRGSIPIELRPALGYRVFGCDDCLAACPWNRFAREGRQAKAAARADLEAPDLLGLLALDEAGFRARFRSTALWRAKRRGLLRNVAVALGNTAGPEALPALARAAGDPEPLIADHAGWAMAEIEARSRAVK